MRKKFVEYSLQEQEEVISWLAQNNWDIARASQIFGAARSSILRWLQDREEVPTEEYVKELFRQERKVILGLALSNLKELLKTKNFLAGAENPSGFKVMVSTCVEVIQLLSKPEERVSEDAGPPSLKEIPDEELDRLLQQFGDGTT